MSITFEEMMRANTERSGVLHAGVEWSRDRWATALTGEWGEACNVMKKIARIEDGLPGNRKGETMEDLKSKLGEELADVCGYLFLIADACGVDLEAEVIEKFNRVSAELGVPHRLGAEREANKQLAAD